MNILAVDYGTKNIGLAWADTSIGAVLPFGMIGERGEKSGKELARLISAENINLVIIGFPIGTDGKENANTGRVKKFTEELKKIIVVPIEFVDERFSSLAADRMAGGVSRDEKSAMILLQDYLEKNKK